MNGKGTLNRAMIIGNFGADPELRTLPDGGAVTNFSIASTETWTDKNNPQERHEQTEWHRITFFGRAAEVLHKYGRKGAKIYVEGMLRTRKWTDKDGIERYTTEIRGRDFTFLSSSQKPGGGSGGGFQNDDNQYTNDSDNNNNDSFGDVGDDDIPF